MAITKKPISRTTKKPSRRGILRKLRPWQIILLVSAVAITGLIILRVSFASENIDDIYQESKNDLNAGKGNNEGVTAPCKIQADGTRTGAAHGWGFDPTNPNASTQVHLYFDAPGGPGFPITANLPSGDVNSAFGIGGAHRFSFAIPAQFYNGIEHSINAYSIGSAGNRFIGVVYFRCYPKDAPPPPAPTKPPSTPPSPNPPPTPAPTPKPSPNPNPNPNPVPRPDPTRTADPVVIKDVIAQLSAPSIQEDSKVSGDKNNSTQLVTVDLLDTGRDLSNADIIAINQKIDEIKPETLKTISGQVVLKPNIPASKGVVMVAYYLNKKLAYYSSKSPYNFDFDTTRYNNGSYRLDVVGFDKDGNQITRLVQKFNISNDLSLIDRLYNDITYPIYKIQNNY